MNLSTRIFILPLALLNFLSCSTPGSSNRIPSDDHTGGDSTDAERQFGSCQSDATSIHRSTFDMGALCSTPGKCRSDIVDVIWMENSSIKIAVSPQMGGAVVYFGKKGLNAQNGVPCASGDTFCQEQWIANRFSDRGRQLQIDLRDQTATDPNSSRTKINPANPTKRTPVVCGDFGMDKRDPSNFLLDGGCGWNPTQGGAWQGPTGWFAQTVQLPGETGGCGVAPGLSFCTPEEKLGDGGYANLDIQHLPSSQDGKIYVKSGLYMNFNKNNPPAPGDNAVLRTDVWSEQWYCLNQDSFEMQVKLHHDGDDTHWSFNNSQVGPGDELVSAWLQGPFDAFFFQKAGQDQDGKTIDTLWDAKYADPNDHFIGDLPGQWFGLSRNAVPYSVIEKIEFPNQPRSGDFGKTKVAYWGSRGVHDVQYPTSAGSFEQELNVRPHSEYYWNSYTSFSKTKP
jgi:hypothetical protein